MRYWDVTTDIVQFNTFFNHTGFAINIVSLFLSLSQTMSGVMSTHMPGFLSGVNYLSPIRYAIRSLAPYTLRDIVFTCNESQKVPDGRGGMECTVQNGVQALQLYNLDVSPWQETIALAGVTIIYRLLAYVVLRIAKTHWNLEGFKKTRSSANKREQAVEQKSAPETEKGVLAKDITGLTTTEKVDNDKVKDEESGRSGGVGSETV
jgi:hypothetical protein